MKRLRFKIILSVPNKILSLNNDDIKRITKKDKDKTKNFVFTLNPSFPLFLKRRINSSIRFKKEKIKRYRLLMFIISLSKEKQIK